MAHDDRGFKALMMSAMDYMHDRGAPGHILMSVELNYMHGCSQKSMSVGAQTSNLGWQCSMQCE